MEVILELVFKRAFSGLKKMTSKFGKKTQNVKIIKWFKYLSWEFFPPAVWPITDISTTVATLQWLAHMAFIRPWCCWGPNQQQGGNVFYRDFGKKKNFFDKEKSRNTKGLLQFKKQNPWKPQWSVVFCMNSYMTSSEPMEDYTLFHPHPSAITTH